MKKIFFVIVAAAVALNSFDNPPKETKLEYKFTVGDQYAFVQNTKYLTTQEIMGMEQSSENAMSGSLMLKVLSLTGNGAKIEAQYTSVNMLMNLPGGLASINLDSEGPQDKTENKVMKAMMKKPFTFTLTKQGVVDNIEGEENLWSGFGDAGLDENQQANVKKLFQQYFGKDFIKSAFEMSLINYPDKKVKVGDTWNNKTGFGTSFPLQCSNTWKFASEEKGTINLGADGTVSTIDKEKVFDVFNGVKSKVNLSGTQKLTAIVNTQSGWPIETKVTSEAKGTMTLLAGGMVPTDMDVPMSITTTSTYRFIKK